MIKKLLEQEENDYVSPKMSVIKFSEEEVIRTSNFAIGDEDHDVTKDAVWFD